MTRNALEPEYETVAIEFITVPDGRRETRQANIDSLAASIERIGLKTPITVRYFRNSDSYELVAGLHRLRAAQKLGWEEIPCWTLIDEADEQARLWEIAENLHRAELTTIERNDLIAEWVKIGDEKARGAPTTTEVSAQVEQKPNKGGRPEGGVSRAARELGIDRTDAQRAVKIATLSATARSAARRYGLDNNKTVLLKAAAAGKSADQVAFLKAEGERRTAASQQRWREENEKRMAARDKATEELVASLKERYSADEIPMLISWLDLIGTHEIVKALRADQTL